MKSIEDLSLFIDDLIRDSIYMDVPGRKKNVGTRINCKCFICGDSAKDLNKTRGWFYLNNNPISYSCFNEGCTAKGISLLAKMKNIEVKEAYKLVMLYANSDSDVNHIVEREEKPKLEEIKIDKIDFPPTWNDYTKNINAVNCLSSRFILDAPFGIDNQKYYYCTKERRLIIPWMYASEVKTYQSRSILLGDKGPKYKFKSNAEKIVYGIEKEFDPDIPYVFIHEGVFDSIFVPNSIAVGSIIPNNAQWDTIRNTFFNYKSVLFFDNPWKDEASTKLVFKLLRKDPKQLMFLWPKKLENFKDVNELVEYTKDPKVMTKKKFLMSRVVTVQQAALALKFKRDI